jgi:hypothetical protein
MGWFSYHVYGGDDTQTQHYNFLKWAKCGTEDEIMDNEWLGLRGTKIPKDRISIFEKNIDKVLKKMPKSKYWNDENAIEWQMLLSLFLDNKLKVPTIVKQKGIDATEYLCGKHAADFTNPKLRIRNLKRFIERVAKLETYEIN